MKITRKELEFRVNRELENFYNYNYAPAEIAREQSQFYYLARDLVIFKEEGGNILEFRDSFLIELLSDNNFKDEQVDFLYDLMDEINRIEEL